MDDQCDGKEMDLFFVIVRRIRLRRNLVIHDKSFLHPTQLIHEARQWMNFGEQWVWN